MLRSLQGAGCPTCLYTHRCWNAGSHCRYRAAARPATNSSCSPNSSTFSLSAFWPKTTSFGYRSPMSLKTEMMRHTSPFLLTGSSLFSLLPTLCLSFLPIGALLIYNDYWSTGNIFPHTLSPAPTNVLRYNPLFPNIHIGSVSQMES